MASEPDWDAMAMIPGEFVWDEEKARQAIERVAFQERLDLVLWCFGSARSLMADAGGRIRTMRVSTVCWSHHSQ